MKCEHCDQEHDAGDCQWMRDVACKQSQIAALRQRLGDIQAGATWHAHTENHKQLAISWAIMEAFRVPVNHTECGNLDSLAVWLWERGVRA